MEQNQSPFAAEGTTDGPASEPPASAPDAAPAASESPEFDPVVLRDRSDGWTPRKQREFIEALADTGLVREAAARVGMTAQSASRLRRRADARAFDIAWDAALRQGARRLHAIAWERAIEGTVKGHYYHGELQSEERVFDNRLLLYLLGKTEGSLAPEKETARVLADWDGWMAMIERGDPPPPLPEPEPESEPQPQPKPQSKPKPPKEKADTRPFIFLKPGTEPPKRKKGEEPRRYIRWLPPTPSPPGFGVPREPGPEPDGEKE